jgi:hypothetical protein
VTGHGKSSTGNSIIEDGVEKFKTSENVQSET